MSIYKLDFDNEADWPEAIAEWTEILQVNALRLREQRVQALLQPKPWWMPKRVWYWLVAQMLVIVELPQDTP